MRSSEKKSFFSPSYVLYACTIFLSAFLLFAIQPMVSKYILPFFGGSSSVWATSLVFFTGVLFVGYAYVFFLSRLPSRQQATLHVCIALAFAALVIFDVLHWHSSYPSLDWVVDSTRAPALNVLFALLLSIGGPYFLLATTGPLLQLWWATSSHTEPYKLYALSNIGSLLALIAYPFLIEPHIPLRATQGLWDVLFVAYALLLIVVAVGYARSRKSVAVSDSSVERTHAFSYLLWIALAALPSLLLVATSVFITQDIAPVPLLWVIPLAIYLVTFILAFAGYGQSRFVSLFLLAAVFLAYRYLAAPISEAALQICSYLLLLFLCGLFCHSQLYARRPHVPKLPLFYLCVSFGGMLGAFCASFLSPLIFSTFEEFPLALALSAIVAILFVPTVFFPRVLNDTLIFYTRLVCVCVVIALFANLSLDTGDAPSISSRNFYGTVQVRFLDTLTILMHGSTLHGMEPTGREFRSTPTSYYIPSSGIGRAILFEQSRNGKAGIRVGVLGLGTGSISVYCRPDDAYVFYEIDPRIETIARTYFDYLARCKGAEVRLGDGRLRLQEEANDGDLGKYDIIAMDAFADDTIPAHLVTLQAIELYAKHLRGPKSIIAIHTSNRYLYLPPVMLRIAQELHMSATIVGDDGSSSPLGGASLWVLLSPDTTTFKAKQFDGISPWAPQIGPLWTDDYTSLWSVVRL